MIGPSSSHTAGAAKLGYLARLIYGKQFTAVDLNLYNSFAETGIGHGTDKALVGGLLGLAVDDERLRDAFPLAAAAGVQVRLVRRHDPEKHPNYVEFKFQPGPFTVAGESLGGGSVRITEINGLAVEFAGRFHTLLLTWRDVPGMVAFIGEQLSDKQVNVAYMQVSRDAAVGAATALLKLDAPVDDEVLNALRADPRVMGVTYISKVGEGYDSAEAD